MTSSASLGVKGGSIDDILEASIDLPTPGGPFMSILWAPAAAISRALLATNCPLISLRQPKFWICFKFSVSLKTFERICVPLK